MFIKVRDENDRSVFRIYSRINSSIAELKEDIKTKFTAGGLKEYAEVVDKFVEGVGLEFTHNLKDGREEMVLNDGEVYTLNRIEELKTKKEIREALAEKGEVEFFCHGWKFAGIYRDNKEIFG